MERSLAWLGREREKGRRGKKGQEREEEAVERGRQAVERQEGEEERLEAARRREASPVRCSLQASTSGGSLQLLLLLLLVYPGCCCCCCVLQSFFRRHLDSAGNDHEYRCGMWPTLHVPRARP